VSQPSYGMELVVDVVDCSVLLFTRKSIEGFLARLCEMIGVRREDLHYWDYEGDPEGYEEAEPHMKGISAVQFISKSTVVIHTIEEGGLAMINVFSCGQFDGPAVSALCGQWFQGRIELATVIERGRSWLR